MKIVLTVFSLFVAFLFMGCSSKKDQDFLHESMIFNKLQQFLFMEKKQNIDSAKFYLSEYENIKVAKMRDDWVHDSFAQCFLVQNRKDSVYYKEILRMLNNRSNYPVFSDLTKSLRIFLEARNSSKSKESIQQYNAMLSFSEESRSERYRIILFQISPTKSNENILDDAIFNLRKIVASTDSNLVRAKYRWLLAHSYYLKAKLALGEKDETNALKYYELASSFSPDESDKKVRHAYFYEVHLVDGFEDYTKNLIEQLLAKGDTSLALESLSEKALYNYSLIKDLKILYKKQNTTSPFKFYWMEQLKNGLPTAPLFVLESYNGDKVASSDYKGKWIVLDFWGTWCVPCREELPKIQKLSDKFKSEMADMALVLTIACNDTPNTLKEFMQKSGYNFIALVSDNKVEKDYNVASYPTKYLITPDGQYFELYLNTDWEEIVEAYVFNDELYGY